MAKKSGPVFTNEREDFVNSCVGKLSGKGLIGLQGLLMNGEELVRMVLHSYIRAIKQ